MSEDKKETSTRNLAKRTHEMIMGMSLRDSLTGLLNRRGWDQKTSEYLKLAKRTFQPISFILMDLDRFKEVNDSEGHPAGDKILKDFANVISSEAREIDVVARIGGDEFAICLPNSNISAASLLGGRILAKSTGIGVSIGIGSDFAEADKKMYEMKRLRKNV